MVVLYGVLKVFGGVSICALNTLVKFQPCCEPAALDNPLTCFTNDFKHLHKSNDFFILSRCTNHSYVLLSPSSGIYFLNRSMEVGYICEGIMEYIRLAMLHYMLDGWECFLLGNVDAIPYEHKMRKCYSNADYPYAAYEGSLSTVGRHSAILPGTDGPMVALLMST
ncbi:tubulin polyglutamylase complex subunit 2 [Echinococcus multilocularis]|uniref:Tubulin polyglutamylase complex subunit 2 n=1 Tax=Echinococcus multilocularis TaxID=6211 RepID=A0A0S4MIX2_ECHMU|nr:tubulin polyglutamylase complex subunit 2 [Echinococcus multilocularis]